MSKRVIVDITSDILCPWCWVGKQALAKAAGNVAGAVAVEPRWHPYFLNKDVPLEGVDKLKHYTAKFGKKRAKLLLTDPTQEVRVSGAQYGLAFQWTKGTVLSNAMKGHVLLWYVLDKYGAGPQNELMEVLFRMYFAENRDVGCEDVLAAAMAEVGLPAEGLAAVYASEHYRALVEAKHAANQTSVKTIPHFEFRDAAAVDVPPVTACGGQSAESITTVLQAFAA
eukprot:TRINITY_DN25998_c0_g1_i1.p2 TRINITY_DN25998_c0_g1~~TRINITY_DN25998_c0_g1_i1.p2  ORF type:complete len:225 (+),score=79.17 TRINITY_DN25998_c0_g1_i1:135-809(+)